MKLVPKLADGDTAKATNLDTLSAPRTRADASQLVQDYANLRELLVAEKEAIALEAAIDGASLAEIPRRLD